MIPKLTVFMILSPFLGRNDSPLFCFALPGTDFIAQMLPLLNIMFGRSRQSLRRRTKHGYEVASTLRLLYQQMLRKNSSVFDVNSSDRKKRLASCNRWKTIASEENRSFFWTCSQGINSAGRILASALGRRQQLVGSVFTFCVRPETSRLDW